MKYKKIITIFIFLLVPFLELMKPGKVLSDEFWIKTSDQKTGKECYLLKIEGENLLCYSSSVTFSYDLGMVEIISVDRNGKSYRIENITKAKYKGLTTAINNIYNEQAQIIANAKRIRLAREKVQKQKNDGVFADNSGYGLGVHRPSTNVNVRRVYDYKLLLDMTHSELHDIYMYVIRNEKKFPPRYLNSVKSASKFVLLQNSKDRLDRAYERGDSVSEIMDALNDYGEAWVENEMN